MARMSIQTERLPSGGSDPNPPPVRTGPPDTTRTRPPDSDSDRTPAGPSPSPSVLTEQDYPDPARPPGWKIAEADGPSLDAAGPTPSRTRTELAEEAAIRRQLLETIKYPGGWVARRRAAKEAFRRATEIAIREGAQANLLLLEAQAAGDLADEEDTDAPARWEKFAAGWPQWALTGVVTVMAGVGQIEFAKANGAVDIIKIGKTDITPYFAPAVFDLSVAGLYALGMYVAVRYKASPWLAWGAGTAIGGLSVYTNTLHKGGLFFAAASAVLLVSWLVRMIVKYQHLPHVKKLRATAKPRLMTSSLVLASRATARRAWTISRRRPIAMCAAQMQAAGKKIAERDLVIRAAELFNTVKEDRALAELDKVGNPPAKEAGKEAMAAWKNKRDQALRLADIVAWDAVDAMLGLDVIERQGIQVNRVTYAEPEPAPRKPIATAAAPAARGPLPTRPQPPRRAVPAPPPPADVDEVVVVTRPRGMKYKNWCRLDAIPGLPDITPAIRCECGAAPEKRCGESLAEHVERRGEHIREFVKAVPDWAQRPEKISKKDVEPLGLGSGGAMEIVWLMNQLREVAAQGRNASGEESTS